MLNVIADKAINMDKKFNTVAKKAINPNKI